MLARESKCQGAWPAKKIQPAASSSSLVAAKITRERKVASGLSISSEVETLADPGSVEQRGVVVLKPGDEYTNPEVAAMIGPHMQAERETTSLASTLSQRRKCVHALAWIWMS